MSTSQKAPISTTLYPGMGRFDDRLSATSRLHLITSHLAGSQMQLQSTLRLGRDASICAMMATHVDHVAIHTIQLNIQHQTT